MRCLTVLLLCLQSLPAELQFEDADVAQTSFRIPNPAHLTNCNLREGYLGLPRITEEGNPLPFGPSLDHRVADLPCKVSVCTFLALDFH